MANIENEDFGVDYMHPFGNPESKGQEIKEGEDAKPDAKRMKYVEQETDGHSMKKKDSFLGDDPDAVQSF